MNKSKLILMITLIGIAFSMILQFLYLHNNPEKSNIYTLIIFLFGIPTILLAINMLIVGIVKPLKNKLFMNSVLISLLYSIATNILPAIFLKPSIVENIIKNTKLREGVEITLNSGFNFGQAISTLLLNMCIAILFSFIGYSLKLLKRRVIK